MDREYRTGPIGEFIRQLSELQKFRQQNQRYFRELTDREVEVLALIARGKNNPKISAELDISRATVQNHRAKIRGKLDINHQTDFFKYALAFELIGF